MTPDFLLQLVLAIGAGCAVYAGIKSDLTRAITLSEMAIRDAGTAHERLSAHVEQHHTVRG